MGKLIYSMMVSLDGFIEGPNQELDWHIIDDELHSFVNAQQSGVGAYLYGRRLYENMMAYWPSADQDPAAPKFVLDFARLWKNMPKIVVSRTLTRVEGNAELIREVTPAQVARLKSEVDDDLAVGGAGLAASFMRLGLIEEYGLFVQPVILGRGTPFFPPLDGKINLRLVETHRFASGVIYLRYWRADPEQ